MRLRTSFTPGACRWTSTQATWSMCGWTPCSATPPPWASSMTSTTTTTSTGPPTYTLWAREIVRFLHHLARHAHEHGHALPRRCSATAGCSGRRQDVQVQGQRGGPLYSGGEVRGGHPALLPAAHTFPFGSDLLQRGPHQHHQRGPGPATWATCSTAPCPWWASTSAAPCPGRGRRTLWTS